MHEIATLPTMAWVKWTKENTWDGIEQIHFYFKALSKC